MSCPFARFKSAFAATGEVSFHGKHAHLDHHHQAAAATPTKSVTAVLKEATWAAHRAIERSPGVAALMGSSSASASDATSAYVIERLDYVRFLVMLLCVYAQMEAAMVESEQAAWMPTGIKTIIDPLLRTQALIDDISDHIDELCGHSGATAQELLTYIDVETPASSDLECKRARLAASLSTALVMLKGCGKLTTTPVADMPSSLVSLLNDRQVQAASVYASRMGAAAQSQSRTVKTTYIDGKHAHHYDEGVSLTPPLERSTPSSSRSSSPVAEPTTPPEVYVTSSSSMSNVSRLCVAAASALSARIGSLVGVEVTAADTAPTEPATFGAIEAAAPIPQNLMAHVYVRYMGDLSGGQHMVRRLSKLFPIDVNTEANAGFRFFAFTNGNTLKESLRTAIDGMSLTQAEQTLLATEASLAFDLNREIFDTLVQDAL